MLELILKGVRINLYIKEKKIIYEQVTWRNFIRMQSINLHHESQSSCMVNAIKNVFKYKFYQFHISRKPNHKMIPYFSVAKIDPVK